MSVRNMIHKSGLFEWVLKGRFGKNLPEEGTLKSITPKVSVILPVYNVRDYIEQCIRALKAQTLSEMEFIFVDDCSTDDSIKPVELWAREDGRVRIIRNKENMGAGRSRNKGIEAAKGEYLAFADPDDWMAEDFYELLYLKATKDGEHDIAKGRVRFVYGETGVEEAPENFQNERIRTGLDKDIRMYRLFTYEHWTAIFNKRLFENEDVRYGGSFANEDTTFLLTATYYAKDIVIEDEAIYYYLQRSDSISYRDPMQRIVGNLDSIDEIMDFLLSKPYQPQFGHYLRQTINSILRNYQDALGKGLISKDLFETVSERLSASLKRFPDYENLFKDIPPLKALIQGRKYTREDFEGAGENRVRVSVIIPVYNPGDAIKDCIASLRRQLLAGLEFIFIDDTSSDGSIEQVEEWARNDNRVTIIHNEKRLGAGASRNIGIEHAKGEYLAFVDSDDRVSSDYFEMLYAKAKCGDHDIAKGLLVRVDEHGTTQKDANINSKIIRNAGQPLYRNFYYQHSTAIYKRKLLEDGKACYGSSKTGEDTTFLLRVCYKTNDAVIEPLAEYYYVKQSGTLSDYQEPGAFLYDIDSMDEKISFFRSEEDFSEDACMYIADRAYIYLMKHLKLGGVKDGYFSEYALYTEKMLESICGFFAMNKERGTGGDVLKKALIEYGVFLPNLSKLPSSLHNMAFSLWTDFLSDDHNLDLGYIDAYIKQAGEYIKNAGPSCDAIYGIRRFAEKINKEYYDYFVTNFQDGKEMLGAGSAVPRVTVIIPVYNVGKYIDNCILSLKHQSLNNMEYIFVDDKSTDDSMEKVSAFAASDNRVSVICCEENRGAGAARNVGIEKAHGEYLAFMDPDDYMALDFYERLYLKATEGKRHDIAKGCRRKVTPDGRLIEKASDALNNRIRSRISGEPLYCLFGYEHTTALYSRHLFDNADVRYGESRVSEDVTFLFKICNSTRDIVFDDAALYSYVQRHDSVTKDLSYEKHLHELRALAETIQWIQSKRKMNQHDYSYLMNKFNVKLRAYKEDMEKSTQLKNSYEDFLTEFFSAIQLVDEPSRIIEGRKELKQEYENFSAKK